jgi:hypothetical protein
MPDRNIVFYAAEDADPRRPFDCETAVAQINQLDESLWIVDDHDLRMAVIVDKNGDPGQPVCLRFLRIRDDRPFVIGPDRDPRLIDIEQDDRVTDFTYAMIWPDGYMAAISSRDAPNIKFLATYFRATSQQRCRVVNLYASDTVQRLKQLRKRGLTKALVKIHTATAEQIELDEKLRGFRAFFAAGRATEAVTIDITLSVDRKRDRYLHKDIGRGVQQLATYGDLVDQLIVTGEDDDGVRHEINLKKQRIATEISYLQTESPEQILRAPRGRTSGGREPRAWRTVARQSRPTGLR